MKNIIFLLTKASQNKLKRLKKDHEEHISRKKRTKNIISLNEARNKQYERISKTPIRNLGNFGNPIINDKILAFIRGWKIRKIMKCQEIINIIKRSNAVSISIKMSQFNPQTRNFIRDYMTQKSQIVDYFLSTLHRLYRTGEWIRSYSAILKEPDTPQKKYSPNVIVNLSMPENTRKTLIQSTSTITPPIMHLNSINSHLAMINSPIPQKMNFEKEANFNYSHFQSPSKNPSSHPTMAVNPQFPLMAHNQRYGGNQSGNTVKYYHRAD